MFLILAIKSEDKRHVLLGTPASAREALTQYEKALETNEQVVIQDSLGNEVDAIELRALADAESAS